MALNVTDIDAYGNMTTAYAPTEYIPPVWPMWLEVTVPIICVLLFIVTLLVIYYKPSKPGDEPLFYIPLTKCKQQENTRQRAEELQVNNSSEKERSPNRNVVVV